MKLARLCWLLLGLSLACFGCASPYRSDQGAVVGGLTGAGVGALVGNAVGHTGAGAAIGAGVGALSGAAIGGSLDDIEARNQAEIAARLGHPVAAGAVTVPEVIDMTRAGVSEDVIISQIHNHPLATPLQSSDLIVLQQQHVSPRVVQALQAPPAVAAAPAVAVPAYAPPPPYWGPYPYGYPYPYPYPYYYRPYRGPYYGVSVRL